MARGAWLLLLCIAGWIGAARAASPAGPSHLYPQPPPLKLYEARVVVTGTDMRSRPAGLAACLADVLVKVSGDPALLHDPRVAALGKNAREYAYGYDYVDRMAGLKVNDSEGSYDRPYYLTVHFIPERIDAALRQLGEAPYTGPRPTLLPIVLVEGARQTFVLTSDGYHFYGQPDSFADAADRYFLKLHLPHAAELSDGDALARADFLPVTGTLIWSDSANGWIGQWNATWHGHSAHWGERGVGFDAAFRDAVSGALALISGHATP